MTTDAARLREMLPSGIWRDLTWTPAMVQQVAAAAAATSSSRDPGLPREIRVEYCDFDPQDDTLADLCHVLASTSRVRHLLWQDDELNVAPLQAIIDHFGPPRRRRLVSLGLVATSHALPNEVINCLASLVNIVRDNLHISFASTQRENYQACLQALAQGRRQQQQGRQQNDVPSPQIGLYVSLDHPDIYHDFCRQVYAAKNVVTHLTIDVDLLLLQNNPHVDDLLQGLPLLLRTRSLQSLTLSARQETPSSSSSSCLADIHHECLANVQQALQDNVTLQALHVDYTNVPMMRTLLFEAIVPALVTQNRTLRQLTVPLHDDTASSLTFIQQMPQMLGLRHLTTHWYPRHVEAWRAALQHNDTLLHLEWFNDDDNDDDNNNDEDYHVNNNDDNSETDTTSPDNTNYQSSRQYLEYFLLRNRFLASTRAFCETSQSLEAVWHHWQVMYQACRHVHVNPTDGPSQPRVEASTSAAFVWVRWALLPHWRALLVTPETS